MDDATTEGTALSAAALLQLQGGDGTITPTAALEQLRLRGRRVTKRTLSFWQEQGLLPPALRVGARGGVYPAIAEELIDWIADCRDRGVKVDVIRELLPMWQLLVGAQLKGTVQLADVEHQARRLGLSREANYHLPVLVDFVTSSLCPTCASKVQWVMKDGSRLATRDGAVQLGFVIAELDPAGGDPELVAWTQLTLPGLDAWPSLDEPTVIVLGLPVDVELRANSTGTVAAGPPAPNRRRGRRCPRRTTDQEVLTLEHA